MVVVPLGPWVIGEGVRIRPFEPRDAVHLGRLFYRSVHEVGSARYSPEQLAVWAAEEPQASSYLKRASDGRVILVAVDEGDALLAYGDLEAQGHIDHLYCAPEATRTGVVDALYDQLERVALSQSIGLLYTEASELALSFFHRRGFQIVERRDFILSGVPIHNYRMEKRLEVRELRSD